MLFRIFRFPAKNQTKRDRSLTKRAREGEGGERVIKKEICENLLKFENGLEITRSLAILCCLGERLAKSRIMPDSGKQKDYVHFGIIMRHIRHINCIFCVCAGRAGQRRKKRIREQKEISRK